MDNTTFIFDGVKSQDMGLHNVRMDDGMYGTPFIAGREIVEDERVGNRVSDFYGLRKRPLEFILQFSTLDKEFDEKRRIEIARWLIQDEYKEFQTTDYLGKVFRVIAISNIEFMSMGNKKGYFEVTFRCDAPWAWTPISTQVHDLSRTGSKTIEMINRSNVAKYYYPEIEFEVLTTDVCFKNLNDGGRETEFKGLDVGETIYLNNDKRRILSSKNGVFRLKNFNKGWFRLKQGRNLIEITGNCRLKTRTRFPIYA